jgi:L-aminopeptidase/D-esterase-like protein
MIRQHPPGPSNLITDVDGLRVGNAEDHAGLTGVTVLLADRPMVAAADIRGGAPGTRETEALKPENLIDAVHAIVLSGGSVFGLDAASAVTWKLAQAGTGFRFGDQRWPCPVVPAAILFDLMNGGDKQWSAGPPYANLAARAFDSAAHSFRLGNVGAGTGAVAGAIKGGLGSASATWEGYTVGALVAVNCVGSCGNGRTGRLWAADYAIGGEMGDRDAGEPVPELSILKTDRMAEAARAGANTTIAAVATDAVLTKSEARRLAIMAADGLAIAIRPAHTPFDGDTVFAVATGARELLDNRHLALSELGSAAAQALARAVGSAIWNASSAGRFRSYRDLIGA